MTEGSRMSASENGHTAGPWQIMNEYDGSTVVIANVDGETFPDGTSSFSYDFVCDTLPDYGDDSRSREIALANARLIAAAPEMHKTGRKLSNEVAGLKAFEHEVRAIIGNTNWSVLMQRLAEADAVLSKAECGAA